MSQDPFAPPQADLVVPQERGPAPPRVRHAVWAMIAAFAVGLLMNGLTWAGVVAFGNQPAGDPAQVLGGLVTFAFFMFLAWRIHRGANWARWLFAIFVGLGFVGLLISLGMAGGMLRVIPPVFWLGSVVQTALQVAAAVLLFTGDAARWFRAA